jgi:hypothetical protein
MPIATAHHRFGGVNATATHRKLNGTALGKNGPRSVGVAVAELMRRATDDKNSFAYLWASPVFKYSLIAIIVLIVLVCILLFLRWRKRRQMQGYA